MERTMANSKKNTEGKVSGVIIANVNPTIVDRYLAHYKVNTPKDASLEDKVRLLAQASRTKTRRDTLSDCDKCKGDSDITLPECPYCGEGGTDEIPMGDEPATSGKVTTVTPKATPAPKVDAKPVEAAPKASKADPKPDAPKVEAKPDAPKAKAAKKRSEAKVKNIDEAASKSAIDAMDTPDREGRPKGKQDPKAPAASAAPKAAKKASKPAEAPKVDPNPTKPVKAAKKATTTAIEPVPEVTGQIVPTTEGPIATSEDLDAAVQGVHAAKRATVVSHWTLGAAILRTFLDDAWKQRRNDKGAAMYRGFKQFCEAELAMSSGYACKLMDIAASFSEDDVASIGVAKLGIALRLPASQRTKLLDEVRDGMPLREVADKVRQLAHGLPQRQDGQGRKKNVGAGAGKGGTTTTPSTPASVLTTTHKTKRVTIKLVKAAAQDKRARKMADKPVGSEITLNGIEIRYTIGTDAQGNMTLIVDRTRAV